MYRGLGKQGVLMYEFCGDPIFCQAMRLTSIPMSWSGAMPNAREWPVHRSKRENDCKAEFIHS